MTGTPFKIFAELCNKRERKTEMDLICFAEPLISLLAFIFAAGYISFDQKGELM